MVGTTTRALLLTMLAAVLAACGASASEVRTARTSGYKTDFATVYNGALAAVRKLYPNLTEDAKRGVIQTAWHAMRLDQSSDNTSTVTGNRNSGLGGSSTALTPGQATFGTNVATRRKLYFIRFTIRVVGGTPWRVTVDGEASSWRLGEEIPVPLKGAERPPWLDGRINALQVAIHERLQEYAVPLKYKKAQPEEEAVVKVDEHQYGDVPPKAAKVVAAVHRAALARDPRKLREQMAGEFTWSDGGESPSADVAVAMWQADESLLAAMAQVLEAGCKTDDARTTVTCPPQYSSDPRYRGYRAGFQRIDGAWKMTFFYTEK